EKTMAEYLQENGFNTYAVIASYILHSKFGINQGFKIYDDSLDTVKLDKTLKSEINAKSVFEKFDRWFKENFNSKFFAWVHFYDPHTPYVPHEDPINKGKRDLIKLYDGELKYTDKYVGEIINRLEEADVADDTLIVIVGDHGEAFGEHTEYASHMVFCYEANLKVPMIFYNKKLIKSGVVVKKRVSTVDIMPTIFDILNIPKDDSIQGVSFENTLKGEELKSDRSVYIESMYGKEEMNWAPLTGIIDGDYKFISLPKPELYNIKKDPLEKENLYRKKGSLMREMDKELKNMILKLSGGGTNSKRELGKEDIEHLKSLGYFSSSGSKGEKNIDPKEGIVFTTKLKNISMKIDSDELDNLEKELLKMKESEIGSNNFLVFDYLYRLYLKKANYSQAMDILKEASNTLPNSIPFKTIYTIKLFDIKKYDEVIRNCFDI
ncbi:MAG: sulfatase, partial [Candidatus Aminicenantes bacterium]|nr:sulfatase [Candidatus Aminicenantes bacterium]